MTFDELEEKEQEVILRYFISLRDEIHLRIKDHTRLVWIKLVVIGGASSFLLSEFYGSSPKGSDILLLLWGLPVAAATFDILIAGNLDVIFNLGAYNRDHLEGEAFSSIREKMGEEFGFWEESIAQPRGRWVCYTNVDMTMVWLITLGSWGFSAYSRSLLLTSSSWPDVLLGIITFMISMISYWYLLGVVDG